MFWRRLERLENPEGDGGKGAAIVQAIHEGRQRVIDRIRRPDPEADARDAAATEVCFQALVDRERAGDLSCIEAAVLGGQRRVRASRLPGAIGLASS